MADTPPLTAQQPACLQQLAEDQLVSTDDDGPRVASGPKGEWLRISASGRLVPVVERARSYLNVNG